MTHGSNYDKENVNNKYIIWHLNSQMMFAIKKQNRALHIHNYDREHKYLIMKLLELR